MTRIQMVHIVEAATRDLTDCIEESRGQRARILISGALAILSSALPLAHLMRTDSLCVASLLTSASAACRVLDETLARHPDLVQDDSRVVDVRNALVAIRS